MTTRFYFASSASDAPALAPPFSSQWDSNSGIRRSLLLTPLGANNTIGSGESGVANTNIALRQYIYGPLAGQTITGTLKGQILAQEQVATDDCFAQLRAFIITPALVVRGVLVEVDNSALSHEFDTSGVNRKYPRSSPASISSVAVQGGDYLVVEIGFRQTSTATNTVNLQIIGDAGADLPEDEIDTSLSNAWIEFSQTLFFGDDPPLGYARNRIATQAGIIASWYKWRPKGASGGGVAQAGPDNPPVAKRDNLSAILRAWQPGSPLPQYPDHFILGTIGPDNPPVKARRNADQQAIATAWYKWRPAGTSGAGIPPTGDNPPFARPSIQAANLWWAQPDEIVEIILPGLILYPDDPPFDQVQVKSTHASIVGSWQPEWTGQQRIRRVVQGIVVVVDNPPFNDRRQPNLLHWEPPLPPVQARALDVQPNTDAIDNPPFKGRDTLSPVLRAWQPDDIRITTKLSLQPTSVDNPPRLMRSSDRTAWQEPVPRQQERKLLVQPGVTAPADEPPRRNYQTLHTILGIWYKSLEQPIVVAQNLVPVFLGSPAVVNFPPPKADLQPPYRFWWADPQPTQMRTMIPQEFIPVPPNPCFVEELPITGAWVEEPPVAGGWNKEAGVVNTWTKETPKVC